VPACLCTYTHHIFHPGLPPCDEKDGDIKGDPQVLLVSGLGLGGTDVDALAVDMLVDFVTGSLGNGKDHEEAARIVKVCVCVCVCMCVCVCVCG
jgi:hypothetical protein